MKILHFGKILLNIPSKVIAINNMTNGVLFHLKRKVTIDDKTILYNINDINDTKIEIAEINNYLYKFNLIKINNIYYLEKNKMNPLTSYAKTLNTSCFIGEL